MDKLAIVKLLTINKDTLPYLNTIPVKNDEATQGVAIRYKTADTNK